MGEPKFEKKTCDIILVEFLGDVIVMMSLKWRHNYIFEVRFGHNQLEKTNLAKSRNFRWPILKVKERWERRAPSAWRFLKICY